MTTIPSGEMGALPTATAPIPVEVLCDKLLGLFGGEPGPPLFAVRGDAGQRGGRPGSRLAEEPTFGWTSLSRAASPGGSSAPRDASGNPGNGLQAIKWPLAAVTRGPWPHGFRVPGIGAPVTLDLVQG
jgi:hypothetical protein